MGFFYQALKKESGIEPDVTEESRMDRQDATVATATVTREEARGSKQKFEVKFPLESLVAFLTPPVVDENIVAMEHCRILRTRIREIMQSKGMRTLLMTSAIAAEGKTLMSVNLAYAMSHIENTKVLLVDADMRRPNVAPFLKMKPERGLSSYLQKKHDFDDVCWELTPSLDVVPTLEVDENSAELLHSQRMLDFLRIAGERYGVILLDGPPLFPIVDAQVLAPLVDGAILVVRANKTPYDLSRQAADMLKSKFIGSVLNGADHASKSGGYGGYYGRYGSKEKK
ncbi:MAG: cps4B [Acidobacteriales bacterium]|nr:cps4B [Terriglobales bacterium]